jgi:hypothetical protein
LRCRADAEKEYLAIEDDGTYIVTSTTHEDAEMCVDLQIKDDKETEREIAEDVADMSRKIAANIAAKQQTKNQ